MVVLNKKNKTKIINKKVLYNLLKIKNNLQIVIRIKKGINHIEIDK